MTIGYGPSIHAYATKDQVVAWLGEAHTAPDDAEVTRLIARASEQIYVSTNKLSERAWLGMLLADFFGGYVDPLTLPTPLTQADYQLGLANAVCAQIEFWLEWGEDHNVVGLTGSAASGKVSVSMLPPQLAVRAGTQLAMLGLLGAKVGIR